MSGMLEPIVKACPRSLSAEDCLGTFPECAIGTRSGRAGVLALARAAALEAQIVTLFTSLSLAVTNVVSANTTAGTGSTGRASNTTVPQSITASFTDPADPVEGGASGSSSPLPSCAAGCSGGVGGASLLGSAVLTFVVAVFGSA